MTKYEKTDRIIPHDRWLDQLVDDELDETSRRRLLTDLELQPDGWRKCALAFLEAQAWRRAVCGLTSNISVSPNRVSRNSGTRTPKQDVNDVGANAAAKQTGVPWYAMAACLLVAFVVGAGAQHVFSRHQSDMVRQMVEAESTGNGLSTDQRGIPEEAMVVQAAGLGTPDETIPVGQSEQQAEVVDAAPSPAQLLEAFRRSGHRIHRQRGIVPFSFEDGRQGFVPVEDLYVVPTNLTTY